MELPVDILNIVKEYAKPVSRSDWKTNIFMNQKTLHNEFERQLCLRHLRIRNSSDTDVIRIIRSYKPIFCNNYYKNFKYNFNE
jgi:hypothetical protein